MAVVREQYAILSDASGTIATANPFIFTLVKPKDTLEGNTIDHVTRPVVRKEFSQGRMAITLGAVWGVTAVWLRKIDILNLAGDTVLRTVVDVSANVLQATDQTTKDLLASLILREGEGVVKVTLQNATGGNLSGQIGARFDLGLNAANFGSVPSLA